MIKFVTLLFLLDLIVMNFANIEHHVASTNSGNLQEDFNDFLDLIPIDDIRNLTEYFYANDESMRNSYDYLRNDGTKFAKEALNELPMVRKFTNFLNDTGVNFADLEKGIKRIVLTDEEAQSIVGNWMFNWFTHSRGVEFADENIKKLACKYLFFNFKLVPDEGIDLGGINSYLKEVFQLIPQDEVLMLFFTKMETSNAFSSLLEKFHEEDYENLSENLKVETFLHFRNGNIWKFAWNLQNSENIQAIYVEFYLNGIDILELGKALKSYFWG